MTDTPADQSWASAVSRRRFLRGTTLTAAAVGVAGSIPGLSGLLAQTSSEGPAAEGAVAGAEMDVAGVSGPLVAQVTDLSTGDISVFQGEREVLIRDAALARRLASFTRP